MQWLMNMRMMLKKMAKSKKKSLTQFDIYNSVRRNWDINPKSRVTPNKKSGKYSRSREKRSKSNGEE